MNYSLKLLQIIFENKIGKLHNFLVGVMRSVCFPDIEGKRVIIIMRIIALFYISLYIIFHLC